MKKILIPLFFVFACAFFSIQILNAQNAKLLWQKPTSGYSLRFSHDGKLLITGGSLGTCYPFYCGKIEIWNVADSSLRNIISPQPLMGFVNDIDINNTSSTIISANGSVYCAANGGCSADRPGQYKFSLNGTVKKSLNINDNVYAIEYSPDEAFVASGTGYNNTGVIRIYDTSFNLLRTLPGHQYNTYSLAFTPDNKYLISGGDDDYLIFWDYKTGDLVRKLKHGDYLNGGTDLDVDASADGKYVSSAGQGYNIYVKVWRQADGQLLYTFPIPNSNYGAYSTARFSADGKYIAAGTIEYASRSGYYGEILVWRLSDGKLVKKIVDNNDDGNPNTGGIRAIAFSETNSLFAYIANGKLKVFSIHDGFAEKSNENPVVKNNLITTGVFPNPFTAQTTIQYSVPSQQFVNLTVYNVYGKPVKVLVNEQKAAGNYSIMFNGEKLTPGTYMYKLNIGNNTVSKTLVLNR